jgi:hypothetical protein
MVLVTIEVIVPAISSYWQYTGKILKDIDKILEDTDNYLKVLTTTRAIVLAILSYWQKYLKDIDKYLKIVTKYLMNLSCAWRLYQATGNTQMSTWRARTQDPELEKKIKKLLGRSRRFTGTKGATGQNSLHTSTSFISLGYPYSWTSIFILYTS